MLADTLELMDICFKLSKRAQSIDASSGGGSTMTVKFKRVVDIVLKTELWLALCQFTTVLYIPFSSNNLMLMGQSRGGGLKYRFEGTLCSE